MRPCCEWSNLIGRCPLSRWSGRAGATFQINYYLDGMMVAIASVGLSVVGRWHASADAGTGLGAPEYYKYDSAFGKTFGRGNDGVMGPRGCENARSKLSQNRLWKSLVSRTQKALLSKIKPL